MQLVDKDDVLNIVIGVATLIVVIGITYELGIYAAVIPLALATLVFLLMVSWFIGDCIRDLFRKSKK